MKKIVIKILLNTLAVILAIVIVALIYFNFPVKIPQKDFGLGITFSHRHSQSLGLDWKETYLAILDDLKVSDIRIPVYWDLVEKEEGVYDFSDVDWQINEAEKRNVKIVLVVGQKVPRWPECHIPEWVKNNDSKRKKALKKIVSTTVNRYKGSPVISHWQVENEPFLKFGICPSVDVELLDQEIAIVKGIDNTRPIIITDSGELSLWVQAASRADIFGTTMYFDVYSDKIGHLKYPIGPNFFKFKHWLIKKFSNQNNIIIVELQGEPWLDEWVVGASLEKQLKAMDAERLKKNIEFAKKTGFNKAYLWGAEWWYWLKTQKDYPVVWDEAKKIFTPTPISK